MQLANRCQKYLICSEFCHHIFRRSSHIQLQHPPLIRQPHYSNPWCRTWFTHALHSMQCLNCTAVSRKTRRKRNATLFFIEGAVQWLNLVFWVIPNVYLVVKPCYLLSRVVFWCGWVRWTCWNTVSSCNDDDFSSTLLHSQVAVPGSMLLCTRQTPDYQPYKFSEGNSPKGTS